MSLPSMQCTRCAVWYPVHGSTDRADVQTLNEDRICPECDGYTAESARRQRKGYQRQPEGTIAGGEAPPAERKPETFREAVVRERLGGKSVREIATRYAVSETTVRKYLKLGAS